MIMMPEGVADVLSPANRLEDFPHSEINAYPIKCDFPYKFLGKEMDDNSREQSVIELSIIRLSNLLHPDIFSYSTMSLTRCIYIYK